jgi:hypothetical protein
MKPSNHLLLHLLRSPSSLPQVCLAAPVPILQSCLSFLIPKSVFKGVSWCIPDVNILYIGQFNPLYYSPLPFLPSPLLFNSFQHILLSHLPAQIQCVSILLTIIVFSFPSSLKFQRVVPLLQLCSLYEHVSDHVLVLGLNSGPCAWVMSPALFVSDIFPIVSCIYIRASLDWDPPIYTSHITGRTSMNHQLSIDRDEGLPNFYLRLASS